MFTWRLTKIQGKISTSALDKDENLSISIKFGKVKSFKNDLGYAVYGRVISGLLFITDWQKHDFITIYYKVQI